jgi:hypothetical protein
MSKALDLQQGRIPRSLCNFVVISWFCWIGPGSSPAEEITLKGTFSIDSGGSNGASISGTCYTLEPPQTLDRSAAAGAMGSNRWGVQLGPVRLTVDPGYISGQTHAILQWQNNGFSYDCLAQAESQGGGSLGPDLVYSVIGTSSSFGGTARISIESSSLPDGYPVLLMSQHVPGGYSIRGETSHQNNNWYYQRLGPDWSNIQEDIAFPEENHVVQIGDSETSLMSFWARASSSSTEKDKPDSASVAFGGNLQFRVRKPENGEISRGSLGGGPLFTQDKDHVCIHAAIAMILDYWGHKYPELHKNTQEEYYAAMDKIMGTGPQVPYQAVAAMNDYFAAKNGCRTGKPVSLRAVGPTQLSELTIERMRHPFIILGFQIEDSGQFILTDDAIGHAFVVDAYYSIHKHFDDLMTWLAVRDTWDTALTPVVSIPTNGNPKYRSYEDGGREWWPLDYTAYDALWVPEISYRYRPTHFIEVEETFQFGESKTEVKRPELSGDDYNRVIVPQIIPQLLPPAIWKEYKLMSNVRVLPEDARVLPSLVVGPPDESIAEGYMLRVQLQQPVAAEVSLTCYSTRKVTVAFDYACKAGTLQLFAGSTLLATIPRTPSSALSAFKNTFTLASEGTTTFALRLTGAAGNELYLDNLLLINPVAEQIRIDLNDSGRVNGSDFALLSAQWLKSGCVAPLYCQGADIDHSGKVDFADLLLFIDQWLWKNPDLEDPPGDFNGDGRVNLLDYTLLARDWHSPDVFLETDLNKDGTVDLLDLLLFSEFWLSPKSW